MSTTASTPATLRIGFIGAGGVVRGAHLPGWRAVERCEITAVCDADRATAEAFAKDTGAKVHNSIESLCADPNVDVVDVCTPNRLDTPAVLAALAAGKHVLCEKPLAVTTEEVRQMAAAAAKARRLLMTGHNHRFSSSSVSIKRFVDAGGLGEVYHARIHALRRNLLPTRPTFIDDRLSGGGPNMDIGVHALDLGLWLMGFPKPVRVSGTTMVNFAKGHDIPGGWGEWDRDRFTVEDFASGFVHFANGATMIIESSWLQHQKQGEVFGAQLFGKKASVCTTTKEYSTVLNGSLVDGVLQDAIGVKASHTEEILTLARAIREGLPSPVPVEQTLSVIAILEAIVESGRQKREIVLAPSIAAAAR